MILEITIVVLCTILSAFVMWDWIMHVHKSKIETSRKLGHTQGWMDHKMEMANILCLDPISLCGPGSGFTSEGWHRGWHSHHNRLAKALGIPPTSLLIAIEEIEGGTLKPEDIFLKYQPKKIALSPRKGK